MLALIAVVAGVVPLSPTADKAGFKHVDNIGIGCQMRLELLQMTLDPFGRGIHLVTLRLGISKTQYALKAVVAEHLHVFVKPRQYLGRYILRLVVVQVV